MNYWLFTHFITTSQLTFVSLQRMFPNVKQNYNSEECIVCILYSKYDISRFFISVSCSCQHSSLFYSPEPKVKISKFSVIFHIFVIFLFLSCISSYCSHLLFLSQNNKYLCVLYTADLLIVFGTVFLHVFFLVFLKIHLKELQSWVYIFETKSLYNLGRIVYGEYLRKFEFRKLYHLAQPFLLVIVIFVYFFRSYDILPWNYLRKPCLCLCYAFQGRLVYDIDGRISIIGSILTSFEKSLKFSLSERLSSERNITQMFERYQKLIKNLNICIFLFTTITSVVLAVWLFVVTINIISNIYIMVERTEHQWEFFLFLQPRTTLMVIGILKMLIGCETHIYRKVSRTFEIYAC